jgi:hypothetical protein
MADFGHKQREHDLFHMYSYYKMFEDEEFADTIQLAASNSLESEELCQRFTIALDKLGDCHRNLMHGFGLAHDVVNANRMLSRLIQLAYPDVRIGGEEHAKVLRLFAHVWAALGLDHFEAQAQYQRAENHLEPIVIGYAPSSPTLVAA